MNLKKNKKQKLLCADTEVNRERSTTGADPGLPGQHV